MKSFMAASAVLFLLCTAVHAETINLPDTGCKATGVCLNVSPQVEYVQFSDYYSQVTVSVNGVIYDSGRFQIAIQVDDTFPLKGVLYGPNGALLVIDAQMKHWRTYVRTGKGQSWVQHYELLSGTLQ